MDRTYANEEHRRPPLGLESPLNEKRQQRLRAQRVLPDPAGNRCVNMCVGKTGLTVCFVLMAELTVCSSGYPCVYKSMDIYAY